MASILIVDDDAALGKVLGALLRQAGFEAKYVASGEAALAAIERGAIDLVVTDLRMPRMDGMQLLAELAKRWPDLPVIMLSAHGNVPLAVEAVKAGAADFVLKPFDREELLFVIQKTLAASSRAADAAPEMAHATRELIGDSAPMREVHALIRRAAPGNATVLVLGETGTGKELVARAIHDASGRRTKSFIKLHCGALPDALLESELFGYEKGAFTGAVSRKQGRVELANEGTLFLDEIGDITPAMQVKLLRVLQEREMERLGGTQTLKVDVRFIAATHRDLPVMVASGTFREDLYYRLSVVPLVLPPLRERKGDIEALTLRFAAQHAAANSRPAVLAPAAVDLIVLQPWPGNVRQLQNFVERLVVLSEGPTIGVHDVERELARKTAAQASAAPPARPETTTLDAARRDGEREALKNALDRAGGNRTVAARILGMSRRMLYYKLDEHRIG